MQGSFGSSGNQANLELKYCERCGGLWLRVTGSGQIYCAACGRAMAELPSSSREARLRKAEQEPQWKGIGGKHEGYDDDEATDLEARGGLA